MHEDQWYIVLLILLLAAATIGVLSVFVGIIETGPGCPGVAPGYLGWCNKAPALP